MPSSPAWRRWLKATGCTGEYPTSVYSGDHQYQIPATMPNAPRAPSTARINGVRLVQRGNISAKVGSLDARWTGCIDAYQARPDQPFFYNAGDPSSDDSVTAHREHHAGRDRPAES